MITGAGGQLGSDLMTCLANDYQVIGTNRAELDLTDHDKTREFIFRRKPDLILHAAAFTNVDECETKAELAMEVNAIATANLAQCCKQTSARLIYFSTDYVFDGKTRTEPYTESDQTGPITAYGQSKLAGEKEITTRLDNQAIMRIAWLYGINGNNFVKTMIRLGLAQLSNRAAGQPADPIKVVNDQIGTPTHTVEIARQTKVIIENNLTGLFHCTATGSCSWYQFAGEIFEILRMHIDLQPCLTSELPRPAPRPAHSVLANERLDNLKLNRMRNYSEVLNEFLNKNQKALIPNQLPS